MQRTRALLAMLASPPTGNEDRDNLYRSMCEDAAENVNANFVSLWRFSPDQSSIRCLLGIDLQLGTTFRDVELSREDYPKYFDAIMRENMICAPDACTHPLTRELTESYFEPNGIVSLLDFIIHHNFRPVAIICCESKGVRRNWSYKDREYLLRLATIASFQTRI